MAEAMDLTRVGRKIWVVKVPTHVAELWRPACESSMRGEGPDTGQPVELGRFIIMQDAEGKSELRLSVNDKLPPPTSSRATAGALAAGKAGPQGPRALGQGPAGAAAAGGAGGGLDARRSQPREFRMTQVPSSGLNQMVAFSYRAGADTDPPVGMKAEGTMTTNYTLIPMSSMDPKTGALQIDAAYRELSKQRTLVASTKLRTVMQYDLNTRERQLETKLAGRQAAAEKRQAEAAAKERHKENKRVRRDKDDVQGELFRLFERQAQWHFTALQRETKQPAMALKEALNEIAIQIKSGPQKDWYELRKEYATAGAAGLKQE